MREYKTGSGEWEEESEWPQLGGKGRRNHGCSVHGSQLIVAGGVDTDFNLLSTTASLDLASGPGAAWLEGSRLNSPRFDLALVTVGAAGRDRLYALGGTDDSQSNSESTGISGMILDTVESWEEGGRRWEKEEERLSQERVAMGAVTITEHMCNA